MVANIYYWGFNQYIIQRTWLQNHCVKRKRNLVSCFLLIPFIVVVPGIAAYVMVNDPAIMILGASAMENLPGVGTADRAYPWLHFLPAGLKGWHLLL
jgi:SSS family solute:Na+ symporter